MRRTIITALVACLAGALTVGAIGTAATKKRSTPRTTASTSSGPPPTLKEEQAKRDAARDASLKKVADALSVSLSDLKSALGGVRDDQLAADVTANRLTQAEADAIKACAAAPLTCDRSNLPAGGPRDGDGRRDDRGDFYAAIAKKLGKDTADVKKAFEDNRPAGAPGAPAGNGPGHGHGIGGPGGPDGPGGPGGAPFGP